MFFTDGDRALSFIEATVSTTTKRERVQKAIRSLLGLGVIEEALRHVKKAASDINRAAKGIGSDKKLTEIAAKVDQINNNSEALEEKIEDTKAQFGAFDEKLADIQKMIDAALVKGDREKLKKDIEQAERQLKQIDNQQAAAAKDHSELFRVCTLAGTFSPPYLQKALRS